MPAPYLTRIERSVRAELDPGCFPGNLPFVRDLNLELDRPVTFFVGENGSGKSTLLEATAVLAGMPIYGGGTNDLGAVRDWPEDSQLAQTIRLGFRKRPADGYFFRAELQARFSLLLEERRSDPDFNGDPYMRYGGKSLQTRSHGEAFLAVMQNRFTEGLFLLDEPESALSPQRQLVLLAIMHNRVREHGAQFLIATHSPILLTFPEARIVSFDSAPLQSTTLPETSHYQITKGILDHPEAYWRHLRET